jgi:hypothetical protein
MLDCKHASQMVSKSMDQQLSIRQRINLQIHLIICDACTKFSQQLKLLRKSVAQLAANIENDKTITLSEEARHRIAQAIKHSD